MRATPSTPTPTLPAKFGGRALASLLTATLVLSAASCEDEPDLGPTAPLTVNFVGAMSGQALALESVTYPAPDAAEGFRLSRLSFYVSDLRLLGADGETTLVSEVEYVELGPDGRMTLEFPEVRRGRYTSLQMRLGLSSDQDALQPKDFPAGSPLAKSSEYWVDWGSYVFLKLEGKTDTLPDGRERYDQPFLYHIGRAATNSRLLSFASPLEIGAATPPALTLRMDVAELLGLQSTEPLPVNGTIDHRNDLASRLMDNATRALTVAP